MFPHTLGEGQEACSWESRDFLSNKQHFCHCGRLLSQTYLKKLYFDCVCHWQAAAEASHYACCYVISTINRDLEPFALKPSPSPPWSHSAAPLCPMSGRGAELTAWLSARRAVVLKASGFSSPFFLMLTWGPWAVTHPHHCNQQLFCTWKKWNIRGKKISVLCRISSMNPIFIAPLLKMRVT